MKSTFKRSIIPVLLLVFMFITGIYAGSRYVVYNAYMYIIDDHTIVMGINGNEHVYTIN